MESRDQNESLSPMILEQTFLSNSNVSELIFGTMRLKDKFTSKKEICTFIKRMYECGITTHHVSHEYSSYAWYCDCLKKLKADRLKIKFVAKHSSPNFKEVGFNPDKFERDIDHQLKDLNTDCLDVVQWMYRTEPIDDSVRIKQVEEEIYLINQTFNSLKKKGKVKVFAHFPYTVKFAEKVNELKISEGLISYLNVLETDFVQFAKYQDMIAIRPLAAGKITALIENHSLIRNLQEQLRIDRESVIAVIKLFPLIFENVKAVIVGINNDAQLKDLLINMKLISNKNIKSVRHKLIETLIIK